VVTKSRGRPVLGGERPDIRVESLELLLDSPVVLVHAAERIL
jgi:hypothetical protein